MHAELGRPLPCRAVIGSASLNQLRHNSASLFHARATWKVISKKICSAHAMTNTLLMINGWNRKLLNFMK